MDTRFRWGSAAAAAGSGSPDLQQKEVLVSSRLKHVPIWHFGTPLKSSGFVHSNYIVHSSVSVSPAGSEVLSTNVPH